MPLVYQQILRGDKSDNRGIRYRRLRPSELDALELKAAQLLAGMSNVPADMKRATLMQIRYNEGIKEMLVAVTKKPVPLPEAPAKPAKLPDGTQPATPDPVEPELKDPTLWEPLDVGKLTVPGEFTYDALFSGPDHEYLRFLFSYNHESNAANGDAILKKERTVSGG